MLAPAAFFPRRTRDRFGTPFALCVAIVLAASPCESRAAALGSLVTSIGFFAAIAAMFLIKGWPGMMPAAWLPTVGGALVVAGGAIWWWRARVAGRWPGSAAGRALQGAASLPTTDRPAVRARCLLAPQGADRDKLLAALRMHFLQLQEAWDLGAMATLRTLATPEMVDELCSSLPASTDEAAASRTDIVTLQAELFAFEELAGALVVSIEFSGLMRESPGQHASPFRELWMLTRAKDGSSGWKLARHQALL